MWGSRELARPNGPAYATVAAHLRPVWWAAGEPPRGRTQPGGRLSASRAYYLAFGRPIAPDRRDAVALHVADGSQFISNHVGSASMVVLVGIDGRERFGQCLSRIEGPALLHGYLPVLEVGYADADGVRYRQESFATLLPGTRRLASFVRIVAVRDSSSRTRTTVRLVDARADRLSAGPGAVVSGDAITFDLDLSDGREHAVYIVRPIGSWNAPPSPGASEQFHAAALRSVIVYWEGRLAEGAAFSVPEPLVMDAQRNLLVQNLLMGRRYSLGNSYETFFLPESSDTVETLGRYGFTSYYRKALEHLLHESKGRNRRNWEMGEKLLRAADYYWLTRDRTFIDENVRTHASFAADLAAQCARDRLGLLERQQYCSDIAAKGYGLHQISRALYGLKAIVAVWRLTGHTALADRYAPVARALEQALANEAKASSVRLGDGSLFTALALHEPVRPYLSITETTAGGYWNLLAPYAFASKLYEPGSGRAQRTLAYLYRHGSRLLGSIRARQGGVTDVYGVEQSKFLADNSEADQLVLSLYGNLAHGRARGTFVAGEVTNVAPLAFRWPEYFGTCAPKRPCPQPGLSRAWKPLDEFRALYNPPNSANNTFFLSVLRATLVHEVTDGSNVPRGLMLAFATPRPWLADGKTIAVRDAPTGFGRVSYTLHSSLARGAVEATVRVPRWQAPRPLELHLRVPDGRRMAAVSVNGRRHTRFSSEREVVDLTGLRGELVVRVSYDPAASDR